MSIKSTSLSTTHRLRSCSRGRETSRCFRGRRRSSGRTTETRPGCPSWPSRGQQNRPFDRRLSVVADPEDLPPKRHVALIGKCINHVLLTCGLCLTVLMSSLQTALSYKDFMHFTVYSKSKSSEFCTFAFTERVIQYIKFKTLIH